MITYVYECTDCQQTYEIEQSIKDEPLSKCPDCRGRNFNRVPQVTDIAIRVNYSDVKTIKHLTDRNKTNRSRWQYEDEVRDMEKKHKANLKNLKNREPE